MSESMSRDIPLHLIDRDGAQPRQHFDEAGLGELAQSMAAQGLIVPIMVRPTGPRYTIVHGERRWRAAQSLGWETIRAEVRDLSADEAHWLALVENVQREDLSAIEEARAFEARLADGFTQSQLGARLGKSQSYIAHKLRLLKLPSDVQGAVARGELSEGHARQLLRLAVPERQSTLCRQALAEGWPVARLHDAVDGIDRLTRGVTGGNVPPVEQLHDAVDGIDRLTPQERADLEHHEACIQAGLDKLEALRCQVSEARRKGLTRARLLELQDPRLPEWLREFLTAELWGDE